MDDELSRAQEYRNAIRRRNAHRLGIERQLAGNPAYAQQVRESWEPIVNRHVEIPDIPEYGLDDEEYDL